MKGLLSAFCCEAGDLVHLHMETMRMSNADMNILWPRDLTQVSWGDSVVLCKYMCAGMAEL